MEKFRFSENDSKQLVDAIVEGYQEYIDHRKDCHAKMKISSAFAWTKGNFIESKIAEISEEIALIYKPSKAGLTWDYLQFIDEGNKKLFLIRNAAYFNESNFSQVVLPNNREAKRPRRTYLHELSKINSEIDFKKSIPTSKDKVEMTEQLSLFVHEQSIQNDLKSFQKEFNEFHILTYTIDDAFQISKIMHYLPNPEDNKAYLVEDLSHHISAAELSEEEKEILAPVQDPDMIDPADYDIGIIEEEEEK